ncbi:MAG TPA: lysophospholipid acyltransferase family protein [Xanthomonadaceae bacterium]|nr:lysophospholipid acyltransferase family protein [Xanthomonadaceae bacterium]
MELRTATVRIAPLKAAAWRAFNTLQFAFTLLWTAGCITLAMAVKAVTGRRELPLRMASTLWAPGLLGGAGATLQVEGADAIDWSRPYMLVSNHQSVIDICALFCAVPVPLLFLLKQEMTRVPFVSWYARGMGMPFIDRDSPRAAPAALRAAARKVKEGAQLCLFPEGTRSRDCEVAPFKAAAFQAAIDAGVAVLPVALDGTGAVLPPEGFFAVRPGTIRVRFGTPIATVGEGAIVQRQALAQRAQADVVALLQRPPRRR